MKYFSKNKEVYAFELDGSQDFLITSEFTAMTDDAIDRHLYPQKYLSDEEKEALRLQSFCPLTRRQFKLVLLENDLLEKVESAIESIEDAQTRMRIQIEYEESATFERTSPAITYMIENLWMTTERVDELWQQAMSL